VRAKAGRFRFLARKAVDRRAGVAYAVVASGVRAFQGEATMKKLASVLVLLCVAIAGQAGEKDIRKGIVDARGGAGPGFGFRLFVGLPDVSTDADLGELCELPGLEALSLNGTKVTDKGFQVIAGLRWLAFLSLNDTAITDEGLRHLESMSNLQYLLLHRCPNITDEGVARLRKVLPKCQIYH
jgi:hypothetical protein